MDIDDSEELKRNKKYAKFQSELQRCLLSLERTPLSDWASLNNGLVQVQKIIDSSTYSDLPLVPERMLLCRVLGKCLDPMGAMGVHRKAVETLGKVCAKLGPLGIAASLPLLSVGVLYLLPMSAMQTRPDILTLLETHFLSLPVDTLALCLSGVMGAMIPALEESDTSEVHRRTAQLLHQTLARFEERHLDHLFYRCLWSLVRNASAARMGALLLLRSLLHKAAPLPTVEEQTAAHKTEFSCKSELTDASLAGSDTLLVLSALRVAFLHRSEKVLRVALDTVVFHFPLHEENVLTFHEKVSLMTCCLRVLVTNPQNSTLRRVFMWIYGGNEYNTVYYRSVSSRYVTQSLIHLFTAAAASAATLVPSADRSASADVSDDTEATLPYEALLALLGRPEGEEHFHELIPDVMSSLCATLEAHYLRCNWSTAHPWTQRIFKLLDVLPWQHVLQYVTVECGGEVLALVEAGTTEEQSVTPVLKRMQHILDATRLHYISQPSSASCVPDALRLCLVLTDILEKMAAHRTAHGARDARADSGGSYSADQLRLALEVFHVSYFGIARGLMAHVSPAREVTQSVVAQRGAVVGVSAGDDGKEKADDESGTPPSTRNDEQNATSGGGGSVGETNVREAAPDGCAVALQEQVVRSVIKAFSALCSNHTGSSSVLPAHDIFSSAGTSAGTSSNRNEVSLFADMCDTVLSIVSHMRIESGTPPSSPSAMEGVEPSASSDCRDGWLEAAEDVAFTCGHGVAVCAAHLLFEAYCGDVLTVRQKATLQSRALLKRLLEFTWPLFSANYAEHHVQLTKLYLKLYKRPELRTLMDDMMRPVHAANCRQYLVLFRQMAESSGFASAALGASGSSDATTSAPFEQGLVMMMNALVSPDAAIRLMSSSFVDQSLPYLHRIMEPLFSRLTHALRTNASSADRDGGAGATRDALGDPQQFFFNVVKHLMTTTAGRSGPAVVQRLWNLPLPSFHAALVDLVDVQRPGASRITPASNSPSSMGDVTQSPTWVADSAGPFRAGADNDMIVNNHFSLCLFLALRFVRNDLRKITMFGSSVSHHRDPQCRVGDATTSFTSSDDVLLSSTSVPAVTPGAESPGSILALDVMLLAMRNSITFADPPETVANMAAHLSRAAAELLAVVVEQRMPTLQVLLLELFHLCLTYLNQIGRPLVGIRRMRSHSEASGGDEQRIPSGNLAELLAANGGVGVGGVGGGTEASVGGPLTSVLSVSPPTNTLAQGVGQQRPSKSKRANVSAHTRAMPADGMSAADGGYPVLSRETLRMIRAGVTAAAVAELHPTLSCYGLLNHWRAFLTGLLPLFHELLHDAVYEIISMYCNVVRAVRERPLSPCSGVILQHSFQGMSELLQYLFRPSTKAAEGTAPQANELQKRPDSVAQIPMWLITQGLGGGNNNNTQQDGSMGGSNSNYALAMKELLVCLEQLIPTSLDTYIKLRRASLDESAVAHRDTVAAVQSTRLQVEQHIKLLVEAIFKDLEVDCFERLVLYWTRKMPASAAPVAADGSSLLVIADSSDEAMVSEFLSSSAGVTPISVLAVCEQLLQRYRRGAVKTAGVKAFVAGDAPFDLAVAHFLLGFFQRCKGADRFDKALTPLLDLALTHLAAWGQASVTPQFVAVIQKVLCVMHRRFSGTNVTVASAAAAGGATGAGGASSYGSTGISAAVGGTSDLTLRDRRGSAVLCRSLECLAILPSGLTDADECIPSALKLVAEVVPEFIAAVVGRDQHEKVSEAFGNLFNRVLGPTITSTMNEKKRGYEKILQLAPRVNIALSLLVSFLSCGSDALVPKKIKAELVDMLFSPNFFKMSRQSVTKWRLIFEKLTSDRSVNAAILQKFGTPARPQTMLSALVQSQDDEAIARGLYLHRLAFYVFCTSNIDREFINGIREKLSDTFRQFGRASKLMPVRYALFVFRVLMTRIPAQLLAPFWPVVVPELIRYLAHKPLGDDDFYLAMESLKTVDFAITILPSEFQVFRWVFLDDCRTAEELHNGCTEGLRHGHMFIPLIRLLAGDEVAKMRSIPLVDVRRDVGGSAGCAPPLEGHCRPLLAIPERCYLDLRGIEGVCRSLHVYSNATSESIVEELEEDHHPIHAASCAASTNAATATVSESLDFATTEASCTVSVDFSWAERESRAIIRQSDVFDQAYVDSLLEAEFIHVQVAATEQRALQQPAVSLLPLSAVSRATGGGGVGGRVGGAGGGTQAMGSAIPLQQLGACGDASSPASLSPRDTHGDFVDVARD